MRISLDRETALAALNDGENILGNTARRESPMIRKRSEKAYVSRGDRQWVYMTLVEACQGLGRTSEEEELVRKISSEDPDAFDMDSYLRHKPKLRAAMDEFERRVHPDELSAKPATRGAPLVTQAVEVKAGEPGAMTQQFRSAVPSGVNPITIDADIVRGKPIKSVEVNCRIE